ncbi:ribosomal-processing cysteine protease Prp [Vagococcus zengguangii]|uniref:Ribosomal processing cysteine protease Prp n=1 Tax=Vagococcus zengguangii TaxID=2571750 RepID=A0A4D7CPG5_9ENTE|nr:ribosomal-processing cysteine protease Prp [Vagococcus zengguangii]QCI85949.1 ribosomal-processing cysteine protease Prp [Vagococcus zengguangii]TLG80306.1 ribosomal-processing cysteine protease Prp [Vagococcus zengguangii]
MIKGTFKRNKENQAIEAFEISGHAGSGPYGSDIVCAAVSALTFSTVNGIAKLSQVEPLVDMDNDNEGYLYVTLKEDLSDKELEISQLLLENLLLGLQDIQNEYNQFVMIQVN